MSWADDGTGAESQRARVEAARRARFPRMAQYSLQNEYERWVLRPYVTVDYPRRGLRCVRQRDSLALCDTYPPELVVPASVSDLELKRVAFRRLGKDGSS